MSDEKTENGREIIMFPQYLRRLGHLPGMNAQEDWELAKKHLENIEVVSDKGNFVFSFERPHWRETGSFIYVNGISGEINGRCSWMYINTDYNSEDIKFFDGAWSISNGLSPSSWKTKNKKLADLLRFEDLSVIFQLREKIKKLQDEQLSLQEEIEHQKNSAVEFYAKNCLLQREVSLLEQIVNHPTLLIRKYREAIGLAGYFGFYKLKTAFQISAVRRFNLPVIAIANNGEWGDDECYSLVEIPALRAHDIPENFNKYYPFLLPCIFEEREWYDDNDEDSDGDDDEDNEKQKGYLMELSQILLKMEKEKIDALFFSRE